jgi:TPR repeat protein
MNFLGSYHFNYTKDYAKAVQCFREAAEKGTCARALNNLGICFELGVGGAE